MCWPLRCLRHLSGHSLLAVLLRLPLRFDPADVFLFDVLVPVGALALFLGACHVASLHRVLLSVCGVWLTILVLFALALPGSSPCSPWLSALSWWLFLAQRHRHVVIILYKIICSITRELYKLFAFFCIIPYNAFVQRR